MKGCPGCQKVTRGTVPSCTLTTHSEACRGRMERPTTQDPVGADRAVGTKTAFARHVEEHNEREKKIAGCSTDAQETTSNQQSSSSSSSSSRRGGNRADNNVRHEQESNDGVHEQDADMNNDDRKETKLHERQESRHCQQEQRNKM